MIGAQNGVQQNRDRNTINNPLWSLFLDSESTNASLFLSVQFQQNYFHSPTPWRPRPGLSEKVQILIDSFRPGSSSYNPFLSPLDVNNNLHSAHGLQRSQSTDLEDNEDTQLEDSRRRDNETNLPSASNPPSDMSPEEVKRRRLYLNFGRPRPFYGSSSNISTDAVSREMSRQNSCSHVDAKSLQDLVRQKLLQTYGIKQLWKLARQHFTFLPGVILDFLLTFRCEEFKELGLSGHRSASYTVRSVLDNDVYRAVYATSEADKVVSNLWEEERDWLNLCDAGVVPVLGLAVDQLTQNIFYILPDEGSFLSLQDYLGKQTLNRKHTVIKIGTSLKQTLWRLQTAGLIVKQLNAENLYVDQKGRLLLENYLLIKQKSFFPSTFCSCLETKDKMLSEDLEISNVSCDCQTYCKGRETIPPKLYATLMLPAEHNNQLFSDTTVGKENNQLLSDTTAVNHENHLLSETKVVKQNNQLFSEATAAKKNNQLLLDTTAVKQNHQLLSDRTVVKQNNQLFSDTLAVKQNNLLLADIPAKEHDNQLFSDTTAVKQNNQLLADIPSKEHDNQLFSDTTAVKQNNPLFSDAIAVDTRTHGSSYKNIPERTNAEGISKAFQSIPEANRPSTHMPTQTANGNVLCGSKYGSLMEPMPAPARGGTNNQPSQFSPPLSKHNENLLQYILYTMMNRNE